VPADWPYHFSGFAAHWNKNSNLAWAFDTWFLNLFPRERPFLANGGGYVTLSFIPTLGTMILGLIAGGWLQRGPVGPLQFVRFLAAGILCLTLGWLLDYVGVNPSVKRIWTPAWTLYSGGWCFLFLAFFYVFTDLPGWSRWAFPLVVIGMNSIAIYCLVDSHLGSRFILPALKRHFGQRVFAGLGSELEPLLAGSATLLVFWLILFWMYRRKIFLRI
jgi:predicted acyltransferase